MKTEVPLLTPLRGLAALCVALFHARLIFFPQWKEPLIEFTHFLENSYLFVDLFFLLSGFVMMHVYKKNFVDGVSFSQWKGFMWLRFSRIYPLFFITLSVLVLWEFIKLNQRLGFYGGPLLESWGLTGIPAFNGPFNTSDSLLSNFFMLHAVTTTSLTWNIASWSLSAEWLSYMVFPFMVSVLSMRTRVTLWVPVLVWIILFSLNQTHGSLDITNGISSLLRAVCGMFLGGWLCNITLSEKHKTLINSDALLLVLIALTVGVMHVKLSAHFVVMTFAILIFIASQQEKRTTLIFTLFDNKITRYLGDISYSVYLWHVVLLLPGVELINVLFPDLLSGWFAQTSWLAGLYGVAVFITLTVIVSSISYRYFERPVMTFLRHKVGSRLNLAMA
ncbi:acyltransferase family protein [Photobacterium nomapromontoriensis]|uniref:acyltransferase family protein n=1 Tax=Photobacterium nomapromontoriensis TaxID=2910237 RepID=UPI003D11B114